ncbi:hypothetical protein Dimus_009995 [Dionaea muscipula]
MESSGWLTQEVKLPDTQAPVSISLSSDPSSGPAVPSISSASVSVAAPVGTVADTKQGSSPGKLVPPGYAIPSTSFTYGVSPNANMASAYSLQSSSTPVMMLNSFASPVPRPQILSLSASSGPSFSYNNSNSVLGFPNNQQLQFSTNISAGLLQEPGAVSSAISSDHTAASPVGTASAFNVVQTVRLTPSGSSFSIPAPSSDTSKAPAPPGIGVESLPSSSGSATPSEVVGSSSTKVVRPIAPANPAPFNPAVHQPVYPLYSPLPPIGVSPQPMWLQPPQMGGLARPSYLPYPPIYPGPLPLGVRGLTLPSVPLPASQPPGVTPVGNLLGTLTSTHISSKQVGSAVQKDVLAPGTDGNNDVSEIASEVTTSTPKQIEAWTAHLTEAGAVYYYNAVTGQSTYEKPLGFKGEADKVTAESTPLSWEKLLGSDWGLVTTNDGKKYYYNTTTKISSWQIPAEVTELRKKQEVYDLKEHKTSVTNVSALSEKVSGCLSAPALNGGGRDSTALRTAAGSSSALDLIKKKLQDSGTPIASSAVPAAVVPVSSETNGPRAIEATVKGMQSENSKDKPKETNVDGNMSDSSSDSEDVDSGPTIEERMIQFKEMLKERGVAPFSKWEKELPKIVFDPRFKAIPSYAERRSLFEHFVRTRADEERKEKRAALKAATEGFKELLEEAKEDIDHHTDYQSFRKKWGHDHRFEALDRKERELLLNERVLPLKKAAEDKVRAARMAVASSFKSMLQEKRDITTSTRWSRVKDSLRDDPRYKSVRHEEREILFSEYISELKAADDEAARVAKAKREEHEKLKERERELRKRKEREEQEMERVRFKVRRKEAVASYQALLMETIKDPQASWTESKTKLEKDPQGRAANPELNESDLEKLFREHIKSLYERCVQEFKTLLADVITVEAAAQETEDGKTVFTSWSTAKQRLNSDLRYSKIPRKEREALWQRHVEEIHRMRDVASEGKLEKLGELKGRNSTDAGRIHSASRTSRSRR